MSLDTDAQLNDAAGHPHRRRILAVCCLGLMPLGLTLAATTAWPIAKTRSATADSGVPCCG